MTENLTPRQRNAIAALLAYAGRTPPAAVIPTSAALPAAADLPGDVLRRLQGLGGDGYNAQNDFATVYRLAGLGCSCNVARCVCSELYIAPSPASMRYSYVHKVHWKGGRGN